MAVCMLR